MNPAISVEELDETFGEVKGDIENFYSTINKYDRIFSQIDTDYPDLLLKSKQLIGLYGMLHINMLMSYIDVDVETDVNEKSREQLSHLKTNMGKLNTYLTDIIGENKIDKDHKKDILEHIKDCLTIYDNITGERPLKVELIFDALLDYIKTNILNEPDFTEEDSTSLKKLIENIKVINLGGGKYELPEFEPLVYRIKILVDIILKRLEKKDVNEDIIRRLIADVETEKAQVEAAAEEAAPGEVQADAPAAAEEELGDILLKQAESKFRRLKDPIILYKNEIALNSEDSDDKLLSKALELLEIQLNAGDNTDNPLYEDDDIDDETISGIVLEKLVDSDQKYEAIFSKDFKGDKIKGINILKGVIKGALARKAVKNINQDKKTEGISQEDVEIIFNSDEQKASAEEQKAAAERLYASLQMLQSRQKANMQIDNDTKKSVKVLHGLFKGRMARIFVKKLIRKKLVKLTDVLQKVKAEEDKKNIKASALEFFKSLNKGYQDDKYDLDEALQSAYQELKDLGDAEDTTFNNDLFRETTLTAVAAQKEFEESQVNEKELAEEMAMLMKKLNKFDNILKPHPVSSEDDLEELEEELEGMVVGYQDGELDFKMVESFFQITELLLFIQMNQ